MANTTVDITTSRKGPNIVLHLTIRSCGDSETKNTQEYSIDDLAKVRFQFIYHYADNHTMKLSIIKQNMDKDMNVKIHVACKPLDYSKQFVCSENWTEYMDMGKISCFGQAVKNTHVSTSQIDVAITVYKVKTIESVMANQYEDTEFTDFYLVAADGKVAVHKICLASQSDVFRSMLTTQWKETEEGCLGLKDFPVLTLEHLKAYMYLGTLPDHDDLYPLLLLASQYMIQDLKDQCIAKLALTIKPEKFPYMVDFAFDSKMPELIVAMAQMTPDDVVHDVHEMKKGKVSNQVK